MSKYGVIIENNLIEDENIITVLTLMCECVTSYENKILKTFSK